VPRNELFVRGAVTFAKLEISLGHRFPGELDAADEPVLGSLLTLRRGRDAGSPTCAGQHDDESKDDDSSRDETPRV